MYLAEIRGKLSRDNENKEDILTSNVFSFFKYSDRKIFLYNFIKELGLEITENEATGCEFYFWPSFEDRTEPDLVIVVGEYYLLIEAKYLSGFGEETEKNKHQLIREIEGGRFEARNLHKKFKIVVVTADYFFQEAIIKDIPKEYRQYLIWINWQRIGFLIYSILENHVEIPIETRVFAEDLYQLLLRKNLRNFEGIKVLSDIAKLSKLNEEVFFEARTARYRGDFIGFLETLSEIKEFIWVPSNIFFSH